MVRRIVSSYTDLNMRYKLFIQYLLLITIPFLLFIVINNRISSKDLEKQAQYSSRLVFEQGLSFLEYKVEKTNTYLSLTAINDSVQRILKKTAAEYNGDYNQWGLDLDEIRKQLFNSKPSTDIAQTRIYVSGSMTDVSETRDFISLSRIEEEPWFEEMIAKNNILEWFTAEEPDARFPDITNEYVSIVRKIPNADRLQDYIGIMRVDMPRSVIASILDRVAFFPSSSVLMLNENNDTIMGRLSDSDPSVSAFAADIIKHQQAANLKTGVWGQYDLNKKQYWVGVQKVAGTDWHLAILIPYDEIWASKEKANKQILLITLIIAPLMLPLAFFAASSATRRIRRLISQMKIVQQGVFNVRLKPGGKDEIGELTRTFNSMVSKITSLLDDKYSMGQEIKSMELKALQSQINPHFLYNTMDLIYWKAMRIHEDSIYELVKSLSKFYKLSLAKGNDIVTLENEIEHIQAYIQIQNARFKNGISLVLDIPESLYGCKLPKITLQPIIENSIVHGILETEDERGTIEIRAYLAKDDIVLEVRDDGAGMTKEKLSSLSYRGSVEGQSGYGAKNIDRRIRLLYGEQYGLSFQSEEGEGTVVKIVLPAVTQ